jgi:hypothetical protein
VFAKLTKFGNDRTKIKVQCVVGMRHGQESLEQSDGVGAVRITA